MEERIVEKHYKKMYYKKLIESECQRFNEDIDRRREYESEALERGIWYVRKDNRCYIPRD